MRGGAVVSYYPFSQMKKLLTSIYKIRMITELSRNVVHLTFNSLPEPIPTLTEWGMIIFMTIMMGTGVMVLRKRRVEGLNEA